LPGAFDLLHFIGRGAAGGVWRGVHRRSGLPVAVKAVPTDAATFAREVEAVAGLDHPHVVCVLDHGVADGSDELAEGTPWLAMPLATGTLRDEGVMPWSRQRRALRGLLEGLAHAHARGVVHLDVKPSNVLVGCRRHPRQPMPDPLDGLCLADFGIARLLDGPERPCLGTPRFMAPEQRAGGRLGPWTDLYAVGCLAWALATGVPPSDPPGPAPHGGIPEGWGAWVARLMASDPADRFANPALALDGLAALAEAVEPRESGAVPELGDHTTRVVLEAAPTAPPPVEGPAERACLRPLPPSWERERVPWPAAPVLDAGLGLIVLREPPFVGRRDARDRLWEALHHTIDEGSARLVLIRGPSGVGVSRLGRWFVERVHEVGAAEILRGSGLSGALRGWSTNVRSDLPAWVSDDLEAERPTPGAVATALADAAAAGAAIVWLDDVHAEPATLGEVREHLMGQDLAPAAVLWVAGVREEDLDERLRESLAELDARDDVDMIELAGLPPSDHEALVRDALFLDPTLALQVSGLTDGNPGFAVSILGDLASGDALVPGPHGFVLRPGVTLGLARDRLDNWRRRLDRLAPSARRLLWLVASLGERATPARLQSDGGGAALDLLVRSGLVTRIGDRVELRSAMLREVLLADAEAAGEAPRLHRAALRAWPHDPDDPVALGWRAHHAEQAGELELALETWLDAGAAWRRRGSFRDKQRASQAAWDLVERLSLPSSDRRRALALGLRVHSFMNGRGSPEHIAQCEALVASAVAAGWPDVEFEGRLFLGLTVGGTDRADETPGHLRRAGEVAAAAGLWDRAVAAWSQLGHHLANLGDLEGADAWFERCLNEAARLDEPGWASVRGHCGRSHVARQRGDAAAAMEHARAAVAASEGTPAQFGAIANAVMGDALLGLGRPADAEPWVQRSIDYAWRRGARRDELRYRVVLGAIQRQIGRLGDAEDTLRLALALAERTAGPRFELSLQLALTRMAQGDWAGVAASLDGQPEGEGPLDRAKLELLRIGVALAGEADAGGARGCEVARELARSGLASEDCVTIAEAIRQLDPGPDLARALNALERQQRSRLA